MFSAPIPQDIIDHIIHEFQADIPALKACALVSRSFLAPARTHLFSFIVLTGATSLRFHRLLASSPHLAVFVRHLLLYDYTLQAGSAPIRRIAHDDSLPCTLRALTHLRSFAFICRYGTLDWSSFSVSLKTAILNLFALPGLTAITLSSLYGVPLAPLNRCAHLRSLTLNSVYSIDRPYTACGAAAKRKQSLESLIVDSGSSIRLLVRSLSRKDSLLDITNLRRLAVAPSDPSEVHGAQHILNAAASSLQHLQFHTDKLIGYHTAGSWTESPSLHLLTSLRSLTVSVLFSFLDNDKLSWLLHFLRTLPLSSTLHTLTLIVHFRHYNETNAKEADHDPAWLALDAALSRRPFHNLRTVTVRLFDVLSAYHMVQFARVHPEFPILVERKLRVLGARGVLRVEVQESRAGVGEVARAEGRVMKRSGLSVVDKVLFLLRSRE